VVGYEGAIACGVDEGVGATWLEAGGLFKQIEVCTVRAQEDVAGKRFEGFELLLEVGGHVGIGGIVDEVVAGENVGAAYDDRVQSAAIFCELHGPGGAALGVAGCFMGDQRRAAEFDFISVVKDAVDFRGRVEKRFVVCKVEVLLAARFDVGYICVHDHVFGPGVMEDCGTACAVVVVGMADEKDLYVMPLEAEFFNGGADLARRCGEVAVDEDVSGRRGDEEAGEVTAADVVEIASDLEGREWGGPVRV